MVFSFSYTTNHLIKQIKTKLNVAALTLIAKHIEHSANEANICVQLMLIIHILRMSYIIALTWGWG